MGISTLITLAIIVVIVFWVVSIYNALVTKKNQVDNAFAQIEVQLKRRYDLIPNLVETAKGYMQHERGTLQQVIEARDAAATALGRLAHSHSEGDASALAGLEGKLSSALGQFRVTMENYPDLKANSSMMQLSEELTSTENKVARSRQFYNDVVTDYNIYRQSFPPVLFAATFGHRANAPLLQFEDSAQIQQAPRVTF
ncbi:LemA family protein [Pokkaliibacter plantistimulans]|uniref:LemA family protein n=1 Tax=Proteobacteria bacterium 228 TaxID=2083153 RepID=A0A2S5KUT7_9PROT|nr:LemA family protein [Pokkaliibacter plantistimulans]PPC78279.1 LemA family protein [Pokkaliibacter plantistimulans]